VRPPLPGETPGQLLKDASRLLHQVVSARTAFVGQHQHQKVTQAE
jgi:hypothetical protein